MLSEVEYKANLLSYGVRINDNALKKFKELNNIYLSKRRVYGNPDDEDYISFDVPQEIIIPPLNLVCNPIIKESSPWVIDYINNDFYLINNDYEPKVITFSKKPKFYGMKLKNGSLVESQITYMFNHILGVFANTSCYFANINKSCKFCSINCNSGRPDDISSLIDIKIVCEAISIAIENCDVPLNNIFISGGNINVDFDKNFEHYVKLALEIKKIIKQHDKNIGITLNVYPPQDLRLIDLLRNSDINIMFSSEVFDQKRFSLICPGKSMMLTKSKKIDVLKKYVEVLGINHVFSFLIHGLEKKETLLQGIEEYAKIGVVAIVHVLRIEPHTEIESCDVYIPNPQDILAIGKQMQIICKKNHFDSSIAYGGRSSLDYEYSKQLIKTEL